MVKLSYQWFLEKEVLENTYSVHGSGIFEYFLYTSITKLWNVLMFLNMTGLYNGTQMFPYTYVPVSGTQSTPIHCVTIIQQRYVGQIDFESCKIHFAVWITNSRIAVPALISLWVSQPHPHSNLSQLAVNIG